MNRQSAYILTAILLLGLVLRLWGLTKESLSGDEMFTAWASSDGFGEICRRNALDVHPPLYYLGLYCWRMIGGAGDGWLRGYSLIWSLLGIVFLYLLGRELGGTRLALLAVLLAALNPLSIFYAQEARNYAQLAGLLAVQHWLFWRWINSRSRAAGNCTNPDFLCFVCLCVAASYTHYLAVFFLAAQGLFALGWFYRRKNLRAAALMIGAGVVTGLLFLPWMRYSLALRGRLYSEANLGWIQSAPPIEYIAFLIQELFWGLNWQLDSTVEDSRWNGWLLATIPLELLSAGLLIHAWFRPRCGAADSFAQRPAILFLLMMAFLPILLVALYGALRHPLYFRPRFALLALNPLLLLIALGLDSLRKLSATAILATLIGAAMFTGTITQYATQQKFDWRAVARVWPRDREPDAIVFFPGYSVHEYAYYQHRPLRTADRSVIEKLMIDKADAEIWVIRPSWEGLKRHPEERDYFDWLSGFDTVEFIPLMPGAQIRVLRPGPPAVPPQFAARFDRWHWPADVPGQITGFNDPRFFHALEMRDGREPFRWSKLQGRLTLHGVQAGSEIVLLLELLPVFGSDAARYLELYARRGDALDVTHHGAPLIRATELAPGRREFAFTAPAGAGPLQIEIRTNSVNLARLKISGDHRDLGAACYWIGINRP